ncbi:gliding motility-associated C-terminal domain-containing protein [Flavobacteriales bacterium]|nr:gliding motility-associated C-terminal domain-containing protein [Flavobacteriales bacterium]
MKKILLVTSIFLFTFSVKLYAQSITNVMVTDSIDCFGDFGEITIEITSTSVTGLELMVGSFASWDPTYFIKQGSQLVVGGATSISISGIFSGNWVIRLVSTIPYYAANPSGNGTSLAGMLDQYSSTITLDQPDPLSATTASISDNLCATDCIAEEELTITGGTNPYSFTGTPSPVIFLPPGDSVYSFTALCAGQYDIFVTDANGCSTLNTPGPANITSFTITDPSGIIPNGSVISNYNSFNVSCNGSTDGVILAEASGGTGPIQYSLDGIIFSPNDSLSNLGAGSYTVYYKDSTNCIETQVLTISEPDPLSGNLGTPQVVSCFGVCDGEIEFTVDATQVGVSPYQYSINNGVSFQPLSSFPALCGDSAYTVIVKDANNCTYQSSILLAAPTSLSYSLSITDYNGFEISCNGEDDGQIIVNTPIGGTAPYQYSSDGGASYGNNNIFSNLLADMVTISVIDFSGCTADTIINMVQPDTFTISPTITSPIDCYGNCNGEISSNPSNGVGQILYSLNQGNQQNSPIFSGLCDTSYTLVVVDDNGCGDTAIVLVQEPDSFSYSVSSSPEYCSLVNGQASITVSSGGTGGYLYAWSTIPVQTTATTTNTLAASTYQVVVTDGNNCSFSKSIIITSDPGFTVSFTTVEPCLGDSSGSATVSATGSSPYLYEWHDINGIIVGETSSTLDDMPIGTYGVVVTDATLCSIAASVDIIAPVNSIVLDSIITTGSSCYGINDAQIQMFASGGQKPYLFSINDGLNFSSDSVFSMLASSTYDLQVKDYNGCFDNNTITLFPPDSLEIDSIVFTHISCFGADDGAVQDIQLVGGTGPFGFTIDGVGTPSPYITFSGLDPGLHTVEVSDANNCLSADIIIINEPTLFEVEVTTSGWVFNNSTGEYTYQIMCNNDSSGYIDIIATGGTSPYLTLTDSLTFSDSTNIDGLWAGNHTFIIQDDNGCEHQEIIMFNEPSPIEHNFIINHISCIPWSNGSVTDSVFGGVGSATTYSYLWDSGETSYSLDNLSEDIYTITVTDENGCQDTESVSINDNNALRAVSLNQSNVGCFNDCDGELTFAALGGVEFAATTSYTYLWNDYLGQNTNTAVGLCVDSVSLSTDYYCLLSDASGCTDTVEFTLTQPEELDVQVDLSAENLISCFGANDGELQATAEGGEGPYEFFWSEGNITINAPGTDIISDLYPGIYKVIVQDANTCRDTFEIYLAQPTPVEISIIDESDITCFGYNDGSIEVLGSGGTSFEVTYSYTLYLNDGTQVDAVVDYESGSTSPTPYVFQPLSPGNYYVIAEDRNECQDTSISVQITQPFAPLTVVVEAIDETGCLDDGIISIFAEGGSPSFEYYIDDNLQTSNIVGGWDDGWHTIKVEDASECSETTDIFIKDYTTIFLPDTVDELEYTICLGQSLDDINVDERDGLIYTWSDGVSVADRIGDNAINPAELVSYTEIDYNSTYTSTYTLTVFDPSSSCDPLKAEVIVNFSSINPMIESDPEADDGNEWPVVLGGDNIELSSDNNDGVEYTWMWSNDTIEDLDGEIIVQNLTATDWYYLHIKDSDNCLGYDSIYVVVGVKAIGDPTVYEAFTPNGDTKNDTWKPKNIEYYKDALVQVFNRWGGLVFESQGGHSYTAWDGTYNNEGEGNELPVGTYYYIIDLNTGDAPETGPVTIIR